MRFAHFFYPLNFDAARDYQVITACLAEAELVEHLGLDAIWIDLLSAPLTIPLVYCHVNSFRRTSSGGEAMTRRRKEDRRAGLASRGI